MTWECIALSKSHFTDELLMSLYTFTDELLAFDYTFTDELSNPKMHKHEIYAKYRRRKHERYTQFCVFFVQIEDRIIGRIQPVDQRKISGLNWTTETKGSKWRFEIKGSKRAFGLVENQPHHFVPRWREVTNFIAGCDEVALKNATS